ncbi:MAG: ArsA family ATPase [Myxococcota bacterium]|nr:ArsA family ATPase [Myxococcota bacterium]
MSVLDSRIIVVTGKGGVGKTTTCMALGMKAVNQGKRVLVMETSGARHVPTVFGTHSDTYQVCPVYLHPDVPHRAGLFTFSITPEQAIEDFVVQQIRMQWLFDMVFGNRVMSSFVDAVPGLHDLVQLGKVFDMERQRDSDGRPSWDLLIVDAPATGHGLFMLAAPRAMMDLTRKGPFHENARLVHDVLSDPERTSIVLVSLPEQLPVNETIQLMQGLDSSRKQVRACVVNEVLPAPPAPPESWRDFRRRCTPDLSTDMEAASDLVDQWYRLRTRQQEATLRLEETLNLPMTSLHYRFRRDLDVSDIIALSEGLSL